MPGLGLGGGLVWLVSVAAYVAIPVVIIAIALRLAGVGRSDRHRRLSTRLARGEITQAEFEAATKALGG